MGESTGRKILVDECPKIGYFIKMDLTDGAFGHEQKGRRPVLVVSRNSFNFPTGLALVCPVTNTDRANDYHVRLPDGFDIKGFIMVDQTRAVDYCGRAAEFMDCRSPEPVFKQVLIHLKSILFSDKFFDALKNVK